MMLSRLPALLTHCLPGTRDCVCTGMSVSHACFKESGNQEMTLGMLGNLSHTHWHRKLHEICVGTATVGAVLGECLLLKGGLPVCPAMSY